MPRARKGASRRQAKKRLFKAAEGYWGGRRKLLRTVKEAVMRAGAHAYRDRRRRKRDFRRLWITRITAAAQERGLRYSELMAYLREADIHLDRKSLSEVAIRDPKAFDRIVEVARSASAASA